MRRLLLVGVLAIGCRRHHAAPAGEVEPVAAEPAAVEDAAPTPGAAVWPPPLPPPPPPPKRGPPDFGTVNGDPNGPTSESINAAIAAAQPQMQSCLDAVQGVPKSQELSLTIRYGIDPDGKPSAINVGGPIPASAIACVTKVMEGLRFKAYTGPRVEGSFRFGYRREQ